MNRDDDFNRSNGTLTGAAGNPSDGGTAWAGGTSHYAVSGNAVQNIDGDFSPVVLEASAASGTAKGTAAVLGTIFALCLRWADANNYLLAYYNGSWTLYKVVGGSYTSIDTDGTTLTTGDYVEFEIDAANAMAVSKNGGAAFLSATDAAGSGNTKHGLLLYSNTADRIDDWSFTEDAGGGGPAYTLVLAVGSYSGAGQVLNLKALRRLSLVSGSYAGTGNASGLRQSKKLNLAAGAYAGVGQTAGLYRRYPLAAASGSYAAAGQDVTLNYSGGNLVLSAVAGSYSGTGNVLGLLAAHKVPLAAGSYAGTGGQTALKKASTLQSQSGGYAVTGNSAGLRRSSILAMVGGVYAGTGNAVGMNRAIPLPLSSGVYVSVGGTLSFLRGWVLKAVAGVYSVTGAPLTLTYDQGVLDPTTNTIYFDFPVRLAYFDFPTRTIYFDFGGG